MTDSMKFGPEWLRNMGQDGCTAPAAPTPRYQLAEHRYGREEMLALFDTLVKAPDRLSTFPGLYVDKTQVPLALVQMSEEETRHWNRGINSDAVLRAMGKVPPVSLTTSVRGSRGGTIGPAGLSDRGRGRGRGGFTTYSRGLSYEEGGESPTGPPHGHLGAPPGGYTRGTRPFDRPQGERSWGERNGLDSSEWTSTSPRKEFVERDRVLSGSGGTRPYSNADNNWRRHRSSEDEDGWRTSGTPVKEKWGGAGASGVARSTSWRDGDRDRDREGERDLMEGRANYNRSHRSWDQANNLPEWAVDGADNSSGSFDAQGAFHGGHTYSDEEESDGVNHSVLRRTRLLSEGNSGGSPGKRTDGNLNPRRVVPVDRASAERVSEKLTPYLDKQNDARGPSPSPSPSTPPRNDIPKSQDSTPNKSVQNSKSDPDIKAKDPEGVKATKSIKSEPQPPQQQQQSSQHPNPLSTSASMPAISVPNNVSHENHVNTRLQQPNRENKSEEAMERMREVADDLVAKLMEEEEGPLRDEMMHRHLPHLTGHVREPEKWFYRDPQGQVQGPFSSEEMAEWFRLGYFNLNLLVRRSKDERFSQLQDLIKVFGDIPFMTDTHVPPVKGPDPMIGGPQMLPTPGMGIPMPGIPKLSGMPGIPGIPGVPGVPGVPVPGVEPDIQLMMQQHQYQVLQQQMFLRQQSQAAAAAAAVSKLSQTEGWNTLSPMEQQQLVAQHIQMNAHLSSMDAVPPILSASAPNPVVALMSQFQQKPPQQHAMPQGKDVGGQQPGQPLDPLQQLIQQMGGLSSRLSPPPSQPPQPQPSNEPLPSDPIQSLLRQLGQQQQQQQQQQHSQTGDSLWGSPLPVFNQGWLGGVRPPHLGAGPPSGPLLPPSTAASLWGDLNTKEMKTEKQILEEQMRVEADRKQQEILRKQEEEEKQRCLEEEARQRREAEEAAAAAEAEKQRKKAEEAKRKEEETRRKDELRKAEEERKKLEEAKRQELAKKKEEEKKRKEEEKKRKEDEKERKRQEEEEKKRNEEERQQRIREAEDQAKRAEAQRQQAEALRKIQEQQQKQAQAAAAIKTAKVAPWSQPQAAKANAQPASLSLAEIQRNQKREKEEQLREQQMILQQIQQQNQQNQLSAMLASSLAAAESPAQMQLKWAERKPPPPPEAKTLEQIQREEQERIAKQMERDRAERAERAAAARDVPAPSVGIWGSAPQSLTWGSTSGPGFWDEVASPAVSPVKPVAQPVKKNTPVKSASTSNVTTAAQQAAKPTNSSTKKKKDEATVMKLFEQTVQRSDEFSQWCHKALASLQPSVDIPTFVGFLRDIESPYEVKDYVRQYLGEGENAGDFARQFLERRSKWRSERRSKPAADDMCAPAPAVNPPMQQSSHDFQEVKGKGKKAKKGKMYKVDKSILGFSVTAAPDRINVGDRDYGEGI